MFMEKGCKYIKVSRRVLCTGGWVLLTVRHIHHLHRLRLIDFGEDPRSGSAVSFRRLQGEHLDQHFVITAHFALFLQHTQTADAMLTVQNAVLHNAREGTGARSVYI